jgi:hypothetical protein
LYAEKTLVSIDARSQELPYVPHSFCPLGTDPAEKTDPVEPGGRKPVVGWDFLRSDA